MRTAVTLEDALMKKAVGLTGCKEPGVLLHEVQTAPIGRESARRCGASQSQKAAKAA